MKNIFYSIIALFIISLSASAQVTPVPIGTEYTGNHSKILIFADGFTSAQMPAFETKAASIAASIRSLAPFSTNASKINIYRVNTVSNQSGVSVKACASKGIAAVETDTYWKVYKYDDCESYAHTMDLAKRNLIESQYGNVSGGNRVFAIIVSNHTGYGGVGEFIDHNIDPALDNVSKVGVAIASMYYDPTNNGDIFVPLHEFLHSYAELADEYFGEGPGGIDATYNRLNATPRGQHLIAAGWQKENIEQVQIKRVEPWIVGGNYHSQDYKRLCDNSIMRGSWVWNSSTNKWEAPLTLCSYTSAMVLNKINAEAKTKINAIPLSTFYSSPSIDCLVAMPNTVYLFGDAIPQIGEYAYTDKYGLTKYNGAGKWFRTTDHWIQIALNGRIMNVTQCLT